MQTTVHPGGWGYIAGESGFSIPLLDPFTNDSVYGCVYPRSSFNTFPETYITVAGVGGEDTLGFSNPQWTNPLVFDGTWQKYTLDAGQPHYSLEARSELDLECIFYDTAAYDMDSTWREAWHEPLGLRIVQRSMAWSGAAVDDFVLVEFEVTNIGEQGLRGTYCGFWSYDRYSSISGGPDNDNLTGFLRSYLFPGNCPHREGLYLAYRMDNDGDPNAGRFTVHSNRAAVGVTLLGSSNESLQMGYNWFAWTGPEVWDWGPRRRPSADEPWRSFDPWFASPGSLQDWYYIMTYPHIAYDQLFAAIDHTGEGWMPPVQYSEEIASGWPVYMYYYFGPFDIGVKEHINFTIAVVGGDHVHNDPTLPLDPLQPQHYYENLDFTELATNARWAQWVYDNPGYDTDSDGYAGEFRICEGDTIWYKGDGVPDFRGNTPPPAPFTRIITEPGKITVRWNGFLCETTKDPFSGLVDFEGYRVYCGLDTRRASLSILCSYDKENFFRLKWHELGEGHGKWLNDEPPYTLEELRTIHNDLEFDPLRYTRSYPLFEGDSVFYFDPVDANLDDLSSMRGIHKVYPDATDPGPDSSLWTEDDITMDYGRPLPKYYEYEYIHENLLPTVPYFVSVTSFDFGYAGGRGNLPPDESNPLNNLTECYAQTSADTVEAHDLDVYVYPNPYRVDADYHTRGYENRSGTIIPDRARLLHFGNLPNVCKISIFSLDGDLIGTIDHNYPDGGPEAMHDWWNLVSRSGLAVESGLYYWVVESAERTQIGKFVILK